LATTFQVRARAANGAFAGYVGAPRRNPALRVIP